MIQNILQGKQSAFEQSSYSYDELMSLSFKVLLNTDYYKKTDGVWQNMEMDENFMLDKLSDALEIRVVGIVKSNGSSSMLYSDRLKFISLAIPCLT